MKISPESLPGGEPRSGSPPGRSRLTRRALVLAGLLVAGGGLEAAAEQQAAPGQIERRELQEERRLRPDSRQLQVDPERLQLAPQGLGFTLDFEEGDLRGWRAEGRAFACQPTLDDNPTARGRGQPSNHQGRFWIGTFECFQGRRGQRPGSVQGDEPTGSLTSEPFRIPDVWLSFRIGGGASSQTRVELLIDDPIEQRVDAVLSASGRNSETMSIVNWNLAEHGGRIGRLRIVDEARGGWGHINVDDFRFVDQPSRPDAPPVGPGSREPGDLRPTEPQPVEVPQLVGLELESAGRRLLESGLTLGEVVDQLADARPGVVIRQAPGPGIRVPPESAVSVVIARGVEVPQLIGLDLRVGEARLQELRLRLGSVGQEPSDRPIGTILGQSSSAGVQVAPGTAIQVTVARGVPVPDLSTSDRDGFAAVLERAGLAVGAVREAPSAARPGSILGQEPRSGTTVPLRTPVAVVIATGVPVPDLVGALREQALARLSPDLRLGREQSRLSEKPVGSVLSQTPAPGEVVPLGTPVSVVLAQGVPVPDLRGTPRDEAGARLSPNLRLGRVESEPSESPVGSVLSQSPAPGEVVPLGTPVAVAVARGVVVPDLRGAPRSELAARLAPELRPGPEETRLSEQPVGSVLEQAPEPGTEVPLGTPVAVVVARGVAVPDLVGALREEAAARLAPELRLGTEETELSDRPIGSVLAQAPGPGTEVPLGTPVAVVVARGVAVPDLVGALREEAAARLAPQLRLGTEEAELSDRPVGSVLAQAPEPAMEVPLGTPVDVVVARGVPVPDLSGALREEIPARLAPDLSLGSERSELSSEPVGTVLSQAPEAGEEVPLATQVDVVLAQGVPVPDLVGALREEAASQLAPQLRLGTEEAELSDRPVGSVLAQAPEPATEVPLGTAVDVVLARGVLVPDLRGALRQEIPARLAPDLSLGSERTELSTRPVGTVLSQTPEAGEEVPLTTPVDVVLAQGVPAPELLERSRSEAEALIAGSRLTVGSITERASQRPLGSVLEQEPAAGDLVPLGGPVDLVVARGIQVPEILGLSRQEATRRIEQEGLVVGEVTVSSSDQPPGSVLDSTPAQGSTVPLATAVALLVAEGVPVPELLGLGRPEAEERLAASRLRVGTVEPLAAFRWPGSVIEQQPAAGAEVSPGSAVNLSVARPPMSAIGGGLLGLMVVAGGILAWIKLKPRPPEGEAEPGEPRPPGTLSFGATSEPGVQSLETTGDGLTGPEICIRLASGSFESTVEDLPLVLE